MRNLLQKKLDKKGFTLAELLIVVAIIAVLVAIAIPLFGGALDRAEKATFLANQRSIKAAGVAAILSDETYELTAGTKFYASASVDDKGNIGPLTVTANTGTASKWDTWKDDKTQPIVAEIISTDLPAVTP